MTAGAKALLKVIVEQDISLMPQLTENLFVGYELSIFKFVTNYLVKYKELPSASLVAQKCSVEIDHDELQPAFGFLVDEAKEAKSRVVKQEYQSKLEKAKSERERDGLLSNMTMELTQFWLSDVEVRMTPEEYLDSLIKGRLELYHKGTTGIMTGFNTFDTLTGGLQHSEMYVVAGRLKQGKTQLVCCMVHNILVQGKKVLFISMEMPKDQIYHRIYGLNLKVNPNIFKSKQFSDYGLARVREVNLPIEVIEGQFKAEVSEIATVTQATMPDVLVVDGAYLVKSSEHRGMQSWERYGEILKDFKFIAHTLKIPLILSFQLNREQTRSGKSGGVGKESIDNFSFSDTIGQLMTAGLAIHNDKNDDGRKLIEILRGRHGEDGDFMMNWNWDLMDFTEIQTRLCEEDFQ